MNFKRFAAIALTLCLALCLCACGGESGSNTAATEGSKTDGNTVAQPTVAQTEPTEKDSKVTYTVTVVDFDGNPVAGARVQMCIGELCKPPVTTDAQGVATMEYDEDFYDVKVSEIPDNMQAAEYYHFSEDSNDLTIELKRKVYEYSVLITDEGGNPVPLVTVQFQNENLTEARTDENGKTGTNGFEVISGIVLTEIPEGYTADATEYTFAEGTYELTIVLKAVA